MWKTLGSLAGCKFPTSNLDLMAQVYERKGLRVARISRQQWEAQCSHVGMGEVFCCIRCLQVCAVRDAVLLESDLSVCGCACVETCECT